MGNPEGQHERSYLWAIWAYQNSPHVLMVTLAARWRLLQHKIFSQAAKKLQKFDGLIANLNFSRSITNFPAWPAQILSTKKIKDARLIEYFFHGFSRCEKMERAKNGFFGHGRTWPNWLTHFVLRIQVVQNFDHFRKSDFVKPYKTDVLNPIVPA